MSAKRERHPRFHGFVCIVKGCERVEYKHELCRAHWAEVPYEVRIGISLDAIRAASKAAKLRDPEIRRWAERYEAGMAASASVR